MIILLNKIKHELYEMQISRNNLLLSVTISEKIVNFESKIASFRSDVADVSGLVALTPT